MNLKLITNEDWLRSEMGYPIFLCQTPFSVANIEDAIGISFEELEEDGLGTVFYCFLSIDKKQVMMKGFDHRHRTDDFSVCAYVHCTEPSPKHAIELITNLLTIETRDLLEIGEYLEPPKYSLSRLDDNNNEIEIARFHQKYLAEYVRKNYEDKGHKQDYYVQEIV
jgi:hypothetical protein